jgi:hypothetical protein
LVPRTHNHGRNFTEINRGIVKLRSGNMGHKDKLIPQPFYFPANFFTGSQVKLKSLANIPIENVVYRVADLQINLTLGEKSGAIETENGKQGKG